MAPRPFRLRLLCLSLLLLFIVPTGVLVGLSSPATSTAFAAQVRPATASHPTSDPLYFPVRSSVQVGCAVSNCATGSHHYWALDLIGRRGTPIYASGAGIAHIGARSGSGCVPTTSKVVDGNWIWIDHGGGLVSKYHHLDKISIKNGQRVTPATKIGSMGHSGDKAPCRTNYLHFELRRDGRTGSRAPIPSMRICAGASTRLLPNVLGSTSWNSTKIVRKKTPSGSDRCLTGVWTETPNRPKASLRAGNRSLRVSWNRTPAGTDAVVIRTERYSTALGGYGRAYHLNASARTTGRTLTKLTNGRSYKIAVAFHNKHGYSAWSTIQRKTPGAPPSKGGSPRYVTWPHGKYVHYGWNRSKDNGSRIHRYEVGIRCRHGNAWGRWKLHMMPGVRDVYYNFRSLGKAQTCQVRVHAKNGYGWGTWSASRTVHK